MSRFCIIPPLLFSRDSRRSLPLPVRVAAQSRVAAPVARSARFHTVSCDLRKDCVVDPQSRHNLICLRSALRISCCYLFRLVFRQIHLPEPAGPALCTMPDDAGRAMDVAHSGGFRAAAVADPCLPEFSAAGSAIGIFVGWVLIGHWAAHRPKRRGAIADTTG